MRSSQSCSAPSRRLLTVSYAAFEMNAQHLKFCSSAEWAEVVEDVLLPWVVDGHQLGQEVLEVTATGSTLGVPQYVFGHKRIHV